MESANGEADTEKQENKDVEWELVTNPQRLKQLFVNTLKDTVMQKLAGAKGYTELANSDDPRLTANKATSAAEAQIAIDSAIAQVEALKVALTQPNNLIPIDKRYHNPTKDFISLESFPTAQESEAKAKPAAPAKNVPATAPQPVLTPKR